MEIPRHWRLKAQRYRLEGAICPTCGQFTFPPRPVCPHYSAQPLWTADRGPRASHPLKSVGARALMGWDPEQDHLLSADSSLMVEKVLDVKSRAEKNAQ
jgi:hypothetical protein